MQAWAEPVADQFVICLKLTPAQLHHCDSCPPDQSSVRGYRVSLHSCVPAAASALTYTNPQASATARNKLTSHLTSPPPPSFFPSLSARRQGLALPLPVFAAAPGRGGRTGCVHCQSWLPRQELTLTAGCTEVTILMLQLPNTSKRAQQSSPPPAVPGTWVIESGRDTNLDCDVFLSVGKKPLSGYISKLDCCSSRIRIICLSQAKLVFPQNMKLL